ncbi:zinc finger CCCH domain-containing protein 11A isoform X2 [Mugil cephalus]|uniref:zinc finger CCCH domain-containing protein 11A isoform X2 n=1 Tax=Mugil cephalus TaxID=48193 RepID=UPI001FB5C8F9|nr:zinc finger CCCH domain-containing protein 11A isoform X2 [Mugil cephalus]
MTNHGDDCYFFYYSTCTKGDSCPFRHCEAAMGNETVCSLWQEGRCFRAVCKFRHMKITKNRKEIACYWENQPAGCQKAHCAFSHEKPRFIEGIFMPPDKSLNKNEEVQQEETPPPPAATLPTTANPQLRGVIKTETQEPVPSPTHPPVVINPADDDEDEDDQFSEEGEDGKFGPSPRKLPKSDDSLNFGVSTLEEIRLRKALKASMKKAGYPIQSAETSNANGEGLFRPSAFESRDGPVFEGPGAARGSVNERLGRKIPSTDVKSGDGVWLKRSLAERLGRVVDPERPSTPPQKSLKPIKERLGLKSGPAAPAQSAETSAAPDKAAEPIRIKTLEEIRQEKAAKSQSQNDNSSMETPEVTASKSAATRGVKRAATAKGSPDGRLKTFSEAIRAKKKRQEEKQELGPGSKKAKHTAAENAPGKNQAESGPEGTNKGEVRVKTLEEIRKEKAARIQAQQAKEAEAKKSSDTEENGIKRPRLLHVKKPTSQCIITTEKSSEVTEKPLKTSATASEPSYNVKVKTFEEIMQEKRLRKQEMDEQTKTSAEAEPSQNRTSAAAAGSLKRNAAASKISLASPGSPSSTTPAPDSTQNPVRKRVPLKGKAASSLKSTTAPDATAAAASSTVGPDSEAESRSSSGEVTDRNTRISSTLSPVKQNKTAAPGPDSDAPPAAKTQNNNQRKPTERTADTKVRPKLNVKPSVVKPAVQVKPGQKRKAAERSAVAAVKPLNSASTAQEEPLQETVFPSISAEAHLVSAVPRSPTTLQDNGSSPPREELQTVPDFNESPAQDKRTAASTVPQSPVRKTPTQPKSRRLSVAASRVASTSAMDDFEDLINEFTDDHLEDDVDPGIGEDVLLRELSEMIDS